MGVGLASRVRAQASARRGARTWLLERASAVALVPLCLWFVAAAVGLAGASHAEARAWLAGPFATTAMLLLVAALFWHARLGLRVIVEDYVHREPTKLAALLLIDLAAAALGSWCAVAVLRVALGS
jgi:succinate dehydrogenase / fumarate reductase membrane anchor subunit